MSGVLVPYSSTAANGAVPANDPEGRYIVVLKESVARPGDVAEQHAAAHAAHISSVYRYALNGYAATLPLDQVESVRNDPRVDFVTLDHQVGLLEEEAETETIDHGGVELFEATTPTGISRTFATANKALDIDKVDDLRVDADVAVIDTGIDYEHADLDVEGRTNCITGTCVDNAGKDERSHGTHVAGTIGAIDNNQGVVGIAPGARLWAVKVFGSGALSQESWIIAGVDWVTAHAKDIEVANMSLGCRCSMHALDTAIDKSVEAGVVYAVAAGNANSNVTTTSPAKNPNVIATSAIADYDGKAGELSSATCENYGLDDRKASFSNYGAEIDIAAPGVCILSTEPGGAYGYKSGTSMAAPHVAGAAAVLAGLNNPATKSDVEAIRTKLREKGNSGWTDTSGDGVLEPLLDVSNEVTFNLGPPKNLALPTVSPGTPKKGAIASASTGTWTGAPTKYSYQWTRCNLSGSECVNVSGIGGFPFWYSVVEADLGHTLAVTVTAENSSGSTSVTSKPSYEVRYTGQMTEYATAAGSEPFGISSGPDGNMWYTTCETKKIGKITLTGTTTEYASTKGECPTQITQGPDGNLWFALAVGGYIGKVTTAGAITHYSTEGGMTNGVGIVTGPDKNIWATATGGTVGKMTTSGIITKYALTGIPFGITPGSDGLLWITRQSANKITKMTTAGVATEYSLPAATSPRGIVRGSDNNLWFGAGNQKVGKITTAGVITEYSLPFSGYIYGVGLGPDGNVWFAQTGADRIGKVTTGGSITTYALPAGSEPVHIVAGPDGNVWFTNAGTDKIAKYTP